ncbi:MAG: hypothetical protein M1834_008397 [Cirrosporium novae-zelandiae]|nr:MAG: hypothetical protein M1834_008397 [Cirrosporium novae-zelandiae]
MPPSCFSDLPSDLSDTRYLAADDDEQCNPEANPSTIHPKVAVRATLQQSPLQTPRGKITNANVESQDPANKALSLGGGDDPPVPAVHLWYLYEHAMIPMQMQGASERTNM